MRFLAGFFLVGLLGLLLLADPAPARGLPVCPGCECSGGGCLHGPCRCREPLTDEVARELLDYVLFLLGHVAGERLRLDPLPTVRVVGPELLRLEDRTVALAVYGSGEIRLGRGLNRPQALVILAHEYGHAWQDRRHPRPEGLTERFSEGFASWVAQVVGRQTGFLSLATTLRDRSGPTYAEGARLFLHWEKTLGVPRLLELASSWVDFSGEAPEAP